MKGERLTVWLICLLLVFSVPWYFPAGSGRPLVFGFPLWCLVSLGCDAAIALLVVWRLPRLWDDGDAADPERS
jgi:hypothetical protein